MKNYLNLVEQVLSGPVKTNRTGISAHTVPFLHFEHNMEDGFPLLTTRRLPIKSTLVELEGFIKGITDKDWYEERGCKFWSYWCSPSQLPQELYYINDTEEYYRPIAGEAKRQWQETNNDLGPLGYSHGWRNFGGTYHPPQKPLIIRECSTEDEWLVDLLKDLVGRCYDNSHPEYENFGAKGAYIVDVWFDSENFIRDVKHLPYYNYLRKLKTNKQHYGPDSCSWWTSDQYDFEPKEGFDQLYYIINTLHNNQYDRRMVCSAWNPLELEQVALPSCHILWNVVVVGDTLNLGWYQRSCDLMLGAPANIASYATLLLLLSKESGLKPGKLSGTFGDCHIYENLIEGAHIQLERTPRELPTLEVTKYIKQWTHKDVILNNYNPHEKINFGKVAV